MLSREAFSKIHIRTLNFTNEIPLLNLNRNPQIIRGKMKNWKITQYGHAGKCKENKRLNSEIRSGLSRNRITFSLQNLRSEK